MRLSTVLDRVDAVSVLSDLRDRSVNYDVVEVDPTTWHHDRLTSPLPSEAPGPPEPDGVWATACRLVEAYEFCDPALIRAVWAAEAPLLGRDMLLEGRFSVLRFYMGVRVTTVIDEERLSQGSEPTDTADRDRVWGWAYETLTGHVERGRMSYEVVKHQRTGEIELVISAYSEGAPTLGPLTTLGWKLFGRHTQLRFYRACGVRLDQAVRAMVGQASLPLPRRMPGGLVRAPSDAERPRRRDAISIRRHQPG